MTAIRITKRIAYKSGRTLLTPGMVVEATARTARVWDRKNDKMTDKPGFDVSTAKGMAVFVPATHAVVVR